MDRRARAFLWLLICLSFFWAGCSDDDNDDNTIPWRVQKIPEAAVKITSETDHWPVVLHSDDWDQPVPMEGPVNTAGAEDAPVIPADGNMFVFFFTPDGNIPPQEQLLDSVTGVWWCERSGDTWTEPERAMLADESELHLDGPLALCGNKLWFCSIRVGNYRDIDLWTAELSGGEWQNWQNAGEQINAVYQAGENYLTGDGSTMYFGRTEGSLGYNDIFVTVRDGDAWTEPVNLGEPVNSGNDESRPFISTDGSVLLFTRMWSGLGYTGPSIFRSFHTDSGWSEPEEIVSNYVGDPGMDDAGNLYFTHLYYDSLGNKLEADIYVAERR